MPGKPKKPLSKTSTEHKTLTFENYSLEKRLLQEQVRKLLSSCQMLIIQNFIL